MLALAIDPGHPEVHVETFDLVAEDEQRLGATLFTPCTAARATLIIHGATAAPQSFYRRFAWFAASRGLRVLTYDYRGVGRSRPSSLRGFEARMSDWAELDAAAAHRLARERFPDEPVVTLGHSFGGQLLGLLDAAHEIHAAVLVGAQLGYLGHWPFWRRLRLYAIWYGLVPVLNAIYGYLPGRAGLGEDLPRGVAEQWARWCRHPDYLASEHADAHERFARFDRPTLFFSFTDDAIAPARAVNALLDRLVRAPVVHRRIDPREHGGDVIGHFGFFRGRFAGSLWQDTVEFLLEAGAGRSAADAPRAQRDEVIADLQHGSRVKAI
jgi:predicted alpha/beta hydrolase